jgi:6-bladed beta-propeller
LAITWERQTVEEAMRPHLVANGPRRPLVPVLLLASAPLWLSACGAGERPAAAAAVFEDSAGVRMVRNGAVGAWGAGPAQLTETVRVGVVEGAEPYQLYEVYSLALDEDGVLYVGNNQTATVRVFGPDGVFVREFGGRGEGPGEYNMVNRVWLAGDGIAITDWQGGGRTGVYTKEGELEEFWQAMRPDGSRIMPTAWTPAGWLASHSPRYDPPTLAEGERWERQAALAFYDPVGDTLGPPVVLLPPYVLYGSSDTHGLDWALFEAHSGNGVDRTGQVFISFGDPYRIEVWRTDGTLVRVVTREHTPVPIGEEDVEALKALIAARYDTSSNPSAQQQKERITARVEGQRAFDPRPTLPPTGGLLVSPDGSFWIERTDVATPAELEYERIFGGFNRREPRPTRWDVFDAEGLLLTTVDLPPRFQPMAARGLDIAGVLKDEMDVEYVVVYRIEPNAETD